MAYKFGVQTGQYFALYLWSHAVVRCAECSLALMDFLGKVDFQHEWCSHMCSLPTQCTLMQAPHQYLGICNLC